MLGQGGRYSHQLAIIQQEEQSIGISSDAIHSDSRIKGGVSGQALRVTEMAGQDHLEIYHKPRQWEQPQDTNNLETLHFTHRKSLPTHGVGKDELYFTLKKLKLLMSDRQMTEAQVEYSSLSPSSSAFSATVSPCVLWLTWAWRILLKTELIMFPRGQQLGF